MVVRLSALSFKLTAKSILRNPDQETLLLEGWPEVRQLVTMTDDPLYEPAAYQQFLVQQGYAPLGPRAYGKSCP